VVKIMVIVLLWLIGVWILWRLDNWARARTSRIPLFGLRGVDGEKKKLALSPVSGQTKRKNITNLSRRGHSSVPLGSLTKHNNLCH